MNAEEKMFQIGLWILGIVLLLTVALQVCYRTQNRSLNKIHSEIIAIQQEIAVSEERFASYVRPEVLRNLVFSIAPKSEVITFHKSVSIDELPDRKAKK